MELLSIETVEQRGSWNTLLNNILEYLKFVKLACWDIKEKIIVIER